MLDTDSTLGTTLWCTANGAAGPGAISWYDHHLRPDPNVGKGPAGLSQHFGPKCHV